MGHRFFVVLLAAVMVLSAVRPGASGVPDGPVLVSAAISLTSALEDIARAYAAGSGGPVRFNFAASNALARQIVNGAPADIFISADAAQMDFAEREGAIDPKTRTHIVRNRLVIVTPAGRGAQITHPSSLLEPGIRRIAIGDPTAVPAGVYAKTYLELDGVWDRIQPKLVPLANVRAALSAAETGGVDAAIVYESDAAGSKSVRLAYMFPSAGRPPILYPGAITTRSKNRAAAERFMSFLRSPAAQEIFQRFKFGVDVDVR